MQGNYNAVKRVLLPLTSWPESADKKTHSTFYLNAWIDQQVYEQVWFPTSL